MGTTEGGEQVEIDGGASSAAEPAAADDARGSRRRRWLIRGAQILAGIFVALIFTECAFRWRADGAFPHVNFYVADDQLGVRLEPGATQRISFGGNPVTSVRVNSDGYRGADLGPARDGEILVVGDSQVFGLGVEENETFAAQLATLTGRGVVNGGVPTYGPDEYTAVAAEMLEKRDIKTVIYTVNFVNDLFEADRPNRERHTVWDGWAVRSETAPSSTTWFPFRKWLLSRSHAVYALRQWHHRQQASEDGFDSEGTWRDVVAVGKEVSQEHAARAGEVAESHTAAQKRIDELSGELEKLRLDIGKKMAEAFPERGSALRFAGANPGDIVTNTNAEAARSIRVTASHIRNGVRYRNQLAARLRPGRHTRAIEALDTEKRLAAERAALLSRPVEDVRVPSVLEPKLRAIKDLCDQHGAELLVVGLPIDVQVSADEWKKYDVAEPIDMTATRVLVTDLVASAESMGARAIDVTGALAKTEAAFLDKDIHMTAAGHRAVAVAINERLAGPPGLARPRGDLPAGRTRVPSPDMWRYAPETTVRGSSYAGCETFMVGEWFRATCPSTFARPTGIEVLTGGHGEELIVVTDDAMTLVMPIVAGDEVSVRFHFKDYSHLLSGTGAFEDGQPVLTMSDRDKTTRELSVSEDDAHLCRCQLEVEPEPRCRYGSECKDTCSNLYGEASAECMETYGDDCVALLACVRGDPSALPPCSLGFANAGGTGQCHRLCSTEVPCSSGTCTPWQGAHICVGAR